MKKKGLEVLARIFGINTYVSVINNEINKEK